MTAKELMGLHVGDEVYTHFSNAYRRAVVIRIEGKHLHVEGDSVNGGKLRRRAAYQSVDTREAGRVRLGMAHYAEDSPASAGSNATYQFPVRQKRRRNTHGLN